MSIKPPPGPKPKQRYLDLWSFFPTGGNISHPLSRPHQDKSGVLDAPVTLFNRERRLSKAQVTGWLDKCELAEEHMVQGGNLAVWLAEFVKHE